MALRAKSAAADSSARVTRVCQLDNLSNQLAVLDPRLPRRSRELALLLEIAVRIGLDDVDLLLRRHAQVDSRVIAQTQRLKCILRDRLHPLFQLLGNIGGK